MLSAVRLGPACVPQDERIQWKTSLGNSRTMRNLSQVRVQTTAQHVAKFCSHVTLRTARFPFFRAYNPADFAHLNVSAEIKDLFQYIGRYKSHEVDLDTSLRCFVPDFIPAVGDMDAFLKVPRPDNKPDELGFKVSVIHKGRSSRFTHGISRN